MSIQSEIERIKAAVAALAASITNKGVAVPDGTKLDGMAALVDSIQQGGSVEDWKITDGAYLFYQGKRNNVMSELMNHIGKITSAEYIFADCGELSASDVEKIDMSCVESARNAFFRCKFDRLPNITMPNNKNGDNLFYGVTGLSEYDIDLSKFLSTNETSSVGAMFRECTVKSVKMPITVSSAGSMFYSSGVTEVDLNGFTAAEGSTLSSMFNYATNLKSIDFTNADINGAKYVGNLLVNCKNLEEIINISMQGATSYSSAFPYGSASYIQALRRLTFKNPEGGYAVKFPFNISYCSFQRDGMVEMFNSLPDITPLGLTSSNTKITITGNPCVTDGTITDTDRSIATGKGWTLVE